MPVDKPLTDGAQTPALLSLLRPSKTRRKHDSHELQDLGVALTELSDERLRALPLSEPLLDAITAWKQTRTHEGKRRQMQYVGKLMRSADPEPLREAVAQLQVGRARDALALHEAERWRAELIANDEATTRWLALHVGADAQQLRSLVRNARKDAALQPEQRSGRSYRELFRYLQRQVNNVADDEGDAIAGGGQSDALSEPRSDDPSAGGPVSAPVADARVRKTTRR